MARGSRTFPYSRYFLQVDPSAFSPAPKPAQDEERRVNHLLFLYSFHLQIGIKQESLNARGSIAMAMVPTRALSVAGFDSFISIRSFSSARALNSG